MEYFFIIQLPSLLLFSLFVFFFFLFSLFLSFFSHSFAISPPSIDSTLAAAMTFLLRTVNSKPCTHSNFIVKRPSINSILAVAMASLLRIVNSKLCIHNNFIMRCTGALSRNITIVQHHHCWSFATTRRLSRIFFHHASWFQIILL